MRRLTSNAVSACTTLARDRAPPTALPRHAMHLGAAADAAAAAAAAAPPSPSVAHRAPLRSVCACSARAAMHTRGVSSEGLRVGRAQKIGRS